MVMEKSDAVRNAKSSAGRRAMHERDAKVIENPKALLILKGHATSQLMNNVLGDLQLLKKPYVRKLQRKNEILPFESGGETHLENLARLNDSSLFALGNHTKKRPNNLILGRMFGFRILDMIEFGVTNFRPISSFKPSVPSAVGSVPCIVFNGDDYHSSETTDKVQSLLVDIFHGPHDIERIHLSGVDRALTFTLHAPDSKPPVVSVRHFAVALKKNPGFSVPKVDLIEVGPSFDLTVRRTQFAPEALWKESMRMERDPRVDRKQKNISKNELGDKLGHIHVGKQDLSGLALARMKGLGRKRSKVAEANLEDDESDGGDNSVEQDYSRGRPENNEATVENAEHRKRQRT